MPKPSPSKDQMGRSFPNERAMCEAWGVNRVTYRHRIASGWSKEAALTSKATSTSKPCTDHTGQHFSSIKEMCAAWGIATSVYNIRSKKGWSTEEVLTGKRSCTDHTGRKFPTTTAMCKAWSVPRATYIQRRKRGWSLEEALTGNRAHTGHGQPCTDHTGREFPSQAAMLKYWGINRSTFNSRLRCGWTLEEALTGNRKPTASNQQPPEDKEDSDEGK